jgi:hypothetical protein
LHPHDDARLLSAVPNLWSEIMSGRRTAKSISRIFGAVTGISRHIAAQSLSVDPRRSPSALCPRVRMMRRRHRLHLAEGFFAFFMSGASISLAGAFVATVTAGITGVWLLSKALLLEAVLLAGAVLMTGI